MCLHLLGSSSVSANAAIWQLAAPKPVIVIPAMIALVDFAAPTTRCPTKQIRFPPTKNHRRPNRSVFAPLSAVSKWSCHGLLESIRYHKANCGRDNPCRYKPHICGWISEICCNLRSYSSHCWHWNKREPISQRQNLLLVSKTSENLVTELTETTIQVFVVTTGSTSSTESVGEPS